MQKIILRLFDICAFRAGPQDIPASVGLLQGLLVVSILVEVAGGLAFNAVQRALADGLFELIVIAVLLYAALNWQGKRGRFLQVYTAIIGTDVIMSALSLPLFFAMGDAIEAKESLGNYAVIALLFLVWEVNVLASILRHAFDIHFGYALVLSVIFIILYVQLAQTLFAGLA